MSHIVTGKAKLKDVDALERAVAELNKLHNNQVKLLRNACPRYFYGEGPQCDFVIKLPGRYDLGIRLNKQGEYELVADNELMGGQYGSDNYGRGDAGRKILGEDCRELLKQYYIQKALMEAEAQGYVGYVHYLDSGAVEVEVAMESQTEAAGW